MLAWLLSCAVGGGPVAVVGLGDVDPTMVESVRGSEPGAMAVADICQQLADTSDPRHPTAAALERMLLDARDREAHFDSERAEALRAEIFRAFERSIRPDEQVRRVVARAAHDAVAALLADGRVAEADLRAADALRRFPDSPVNPTRHPPAVMRVFARAGERIARAPHARLRVQADLPGTIIVEGFDLGSVEEAGEFALPPGQYRVWWRGEDGSTSLPHPVDLAAGHADLHIEASLEREVHLVPGVRLACTEECGPRLRELGRRIDVARVIGVRAGGPGITVDVATGKQRRWPEPAITAPEVPGDSFNGWTLVPFGVGQLTEDRPVAGSMWAAAEAVLLVWHVVTWKQHGDAANTGDLERERDLRVRRNVSAAIFYSTVAVGIAEAVLFHKLTGD